MKGLSLKLKLILSFAIMSLAILVVGLLGFRSIGKLGSDIDYLGHQEFQGLELAFKAEIELLKLSRQMTEFLTPTSSAEDRQVAIDTIADFRSSYGSIMESYEALEMTPEAERIYQQFRSELLPWADANNQIISLNNDLLETGILNPTELLQKLEGFKSDHYKGITNVVKHIEAGETFTGGDDHTACRYGEWLLTYDGQNPIINQVIKESGPTHEAYHRSIRLIQEQLARGEQEAARAEVTERLLGHAEGVIAYFDGIMAEVDKAEAIFSEMTTIEQEIVAPREKQAISTLNQLVDKRVENSNQRVENSVSAAATARTAALTIVVIAVAASLIFGVFFGNRLSTRLNGMAGLIERSAAETKSAAEQVASASSTLAEGASEQAASLEETSSSMEQMTSLVSRDAELALTTSQFAQNAHNSGKTGVESMSKLRRGVDAAGTSAEELSQAMDRIKASSDRISKIIKTIDEIAFQTNILALNAAVEAARAGEAGAGFAVVADEVRSLAHRAAEAARETQGLIEDSIERSAEGVRVNANVNEHLNQVLQLASAVDQELQGIVSNVSSVDQSMNELRSSLDEQQSGIGEINTGVIQINDVTQSNAASAEEAASASEELTAQANSLVEVVEELTLLVHGGNKDSAPDRLRLKA